MPWIPEDATRFTAKADTPRRRKMWADIANVALKHGHTEESAIREANAVVARDHKVFVRL